MSPDAVRAAMRLPPDADVDRRVPKNAFMEQIKGLADRKQFDAVVERMDWLATLSPGTVGVAAGQGDHAPIEEVQVMSLTARRDVPRRLLQVIHAALPYPLVLLTMSPSAEACVWSVLPGYRSAGQLVSIPMLPDPATSGFAASIDLARLPRADLGLLYDGLVERSQAVVAARLSGSGFRLPANADEAQARVAALADYAKADAAYRTIRSALSKEKRLAQAVELGEKARQAKHALDDATGRLR